MKMDIVEHYLIPSKEFYVTMIRLEPKEGTIGDLPILISLMLDYKNRDEPLLLVSLE